MTDAKKKKKQMNPESLQHENLNDFSIIYNLIYSTSVCHRHSNLLHYCPTIQLLKC